MSDTHTPPGSRSGSDAGHEERPELSPKQSSSYFNPVTASFRATQAVAKGTTNVVGNVFTSSVTTVGKAGKGVGNSVVQAGKGIGDTVAMGGTFVGSTVAKGAQGIVGGGKAITQGVVGVVEGTGKTVKKGAKGVVGGTTAVVGFGAQGLVKFTKSVATLGGYSKGRTSKWDQGVECIESLMDPESDTYKAMTPEQRQGLADVKKLLFKGPQDDKISHVPVDLIQQQKQNIRDSMDMTANSVKTKSSRRSSVEQARRGSSNFILQEYAGVRNETLFDDMTEYLEQVEEEFELSDGSFEVRMDKPEDTLDLQDESDTVYIPPEFSYLDKADQVELFKMLALDKMDKWDFNVFELDRVTKGHPLLFMGYAILGSPHAQKAMAKECSMQEEFEAWQRDSCVRQGYSFVEEFNIPLNKLGNFLRVIEQDYHDDNPYHNAIHAADVLQSLHALIQMTQGQVLLSQVPNIDLLAILLSAVVHDVDHPGKTNNFHTNLRTELAVMYNDTSVLENWHIAHAFARMLEMSLADTQTTVTSFDNDKNKHCEFNILCNVTKEEFNTIRNRMIDAVLHTDMTKHFAMVNTAKGLLLQDEDGGIGWEVLMFMLHMADISGQAKPDPLFRLWTTRCMDEFFAQGDKEAELGLPISPNCDRSTNVAESQTGFIKFVVGPAYEVLGGFIPAVQEQVVPICESNLETWINEKDHVEC